MTKLVNTYTGRFANITMHHTHKNWYTHKLQPVLETDNATILWNFAMHTDRKIDASRYFC